MGINNLAETQYCVPLRLHRQGDIWKCLCSGTGHRNSVSRARIAGGLYDILPTTHAVAALNKILTLGASLNDVFFELAALTLLSVLYFVIGVWMFTRFHLQS